MKPELARSWLVACEKAITVSIPFRQPVEGFRLKPVGGRPAVRDAHAIESITLG
ncbi:MAG: hypothetical protein M3082_18400 [Candidatus Dormibacteraeota bacterium]|nr:hypothetical protein [Candidatus Dormibacteraeota bacterium]